MELLLTKYPKPNVTINLCRVKLKTENPTFKHNYVYFLEYCFLGFCRLRIKVSKNQKKRIMNNPLYFPELPTKKHILSTFTQQGFKKKNPRNNNINISHYKVTIFGVRFSLYGFCNDIDLTTHQLEKLKNLLINYITTK